MTMKKYTNHFKRKFYVNTKYKKLMVVIDKFKSDRFTDITIINQEVFNELIYHKKINKPFTPIGFRKQYIYVKKVRPITIVIKVKVVYNEIIE